MLYRGKSENLQAFFHTGRKLHYQKNEIILRPEDTPQGVYFIETGLIKIYSLTKQGNEHVHHFFGTCDFFPMIWTFQQHDRMSFFEALAPTTISVVPRKEFMEHISNNREILYELLEEMIERYHRYSGRIDNLLYSDARERCAYRLLSLANRFGTRTKEGILIEVNITHQDLAHSINMTRETFGRTFNRFRQRGIITSDVNRHLIIKDLSVLIGIIGREETAAMWPALIKAVEDQPA